MLIDLTSWMEGALTKRVDPAVLRADDETARRNKAVMDEVREFADELNAVIVGSAGKAA
jgi:hypothetical protein